MAAGGYKVRLPDGSEIGNMALDSVREWYSQGLLSRDSPVLKPGSKTWQPLAQAVDLKDMKAPAPGRRRARDDADDDKTATVGVARSYWGGGSGLQTWRTVVAGLVFLAGAAVAAFCVFSPDRWIAGLDQTPWREIGLAQLALGLALIRGWDFGRKLVRAIVVLAVIALFPMTGIFIAQGLRGRALAVLACAGVTLVGLVALLARGPLHWLRSSLAILTVLGGWMGIVSLGVVPQSPELQRIREYALPQRQVTNAGLGLNFSVPEGWYLLKPEQPFVTVPVGTIAVLAQPRLGGFALVVAEAAPRGVLTVEDYLKRFLAQRLPGLPGFTEISRSDAVLGAVLGRSVAARWTSSSGPVRDYTVVGKDGWNCLAMAAWLPEDGSSRAGSELRDLGQRINLSGVNRAHLEEAVQSATREAPHLTVPAAELVMSTSSAHVLQPEETFRRAYELAGRGLSGLTPAEAQELADLIGAASAPLSRQARSRLTDYLERVRAGRITTREEDQEMSRMLKDAFLRLPSQRLGRLQALYEKAIRAAVVTS
jgi:hypothetical protein